MNNRQELMDAVARRTPARIPFTFDAREETIANLRRYLSLAADAELDAHFNCNRFSSLWSAPGAGPRLPEREARNATGDPRVAIDIWGVRREVQEAGGARYWEIARHPLAAAESVADVERYDWPRPEEVVFPDLPAGFDVAAWKRDRVVLDMSLGPFGVPWQMRGMERFMLDLALNPALAEAMVARTEAFTLGCLEIVFRKYPGVVDLIGSGDDYGSQCGLLLSPDMIARFFLPSLKRHYDLARRHGALGYHHSCGAIYDMVPLFMQGFVDADGNPRDSRVMPRIYQQIDWSNGGDGIVVRENIRTVSDLRGRKIVLAQNSPSHYFALNMLVFGGVQPNEVEWIFTQDAFQAAAAYNARPDISAVVTWAPDIYNLSDAPGNRMLVNTLTANKLIADVWFARADFARDHRDICEGLVRGIFDAMETLYDDESAQDRVAVLMGAGYELPAEEAKAMLADAHWTNWSENYQFLVNRNNPAGFQRVWNQAYMLYSRIGTINHEQVSFEQVMDFSIIQDLADVPQYANQTDRYQVHFDNRSVAEITGAESPILTQTVTINFYPNDWNLHKTITREVDGNTVEELYDPNVDSVLEQIATLAGEFGFSRIVISGHTDSSMRGQVPSELVVDLSNRRANGVKDALVQSYSINPNQLSVRGAGWDEPADPHDTNNHAKNRRVEIAVYPAEVQ